MKFAKEQRVRVPGIEAQGVILDATETVPGFPIYTIRWLTEGGETMTGTCGEGDLALAQTVVGVVADRINALQRQASAKRKPAKKKSSAKRKR